MTTQSEKAEAFQALHEGDETFIIPNPWDAGSACLLEKLGFKALATTSAGFAETLGRVDGQVSVGEKIEHCRLLASVTEIPINVDFENGFADLPADAAGNLAKLSEVGVAGASIEDYSGSAIYDFDLAVERISACAEVASKLPFPFVLTARAEGLLRREGDLDEIIRRLQAFEDAGADVLYAPGLADLEQVKRVLEAVAKPINVLAAFMPAVSLAEYAELGVRRLSVGSALANHATRATQSAAKRMLESGRFDWM
jgi:2-methylisocitrate lyase-like PEP mutase family enzyme